MTSPGLQACEYQQVLKSPTQMVPSGSPLPKVGFEFDPLSSQFPPEVLQGTLTRPFQYVAHQVVCIIGIMERNEVDQTQQNFWSLDPLNRVFVT